MSDALNYLVKVRPEAMTGYFTFLKKAGDHLDVRTRDLISVITKVAVQTEPGFKQYLTRALRNGATPHEIIDALLMAFPVLGLGKPGHHGHTRDSNSEYRGEQLIHFSRTIQVRIRYINSRRLYLGPPGWRPTRRPTGVMTMATRRWR